MDLGLKGKTAIVTGGALGLGRTCALALAGEGVNVAIADINEQEANDVVHKIQGLGSEGLFIKTDVSQSDHVNTMVDQVIRKFGRIDILFSNAGIVGPQGPWWELPEKEGFDRVIAINLKGMYNFVKAVVPHMIKQKKGKIIMSSSCAGKTGEAYNGVYSVTKGAAWNMTHSLATEVGQFGINVNCVCPAAMDTGLMEEVYQNRAKYWGLGVDEFRNQIQSGFLMPGSLTTQDAANVVLFLASECSNMMTGQGVNITGGIEKH